MRNVRSLLLAAVALSMTTACSYSSSRSWGSGTTANPNHGSTGKPAQHSKGKPAHKNPTPAPAPAPAPAAKPAPAPAPEAVPPTETDPSRVGRDDDAKPPRVGRDDNTNPASIPTAGVKIGAQPVEPKPDPNKVGLASTPAPSTGKAIKVAPVKPAPVAPADKAR